MEAVVLIREIIDQQYDETVRFKLKSDFSSRRYLESFDASESAFFYGRKDKVSELHQLYKNASFLVLHGPSGAGKTSLVRCGLVNRLGMKEEDLYVFKRTSNFIESMSAATDASQNESFGASLVNEIKESVRLIRSVEHFTLEIKHVSDEIFEYRENAEKRNEHVIRRRTLVSDRQSAQEGLDRLVKTLGRKFGLLHQKNQRTPLFVFDQFEEIFKSGNETEIGDFGRWLKIVRDNSFQVNILLVVADEYFGHLDLLSEYIPQVYHNAVRLLDPIEMTGAGILYMLLENSEKDEIVSKGPIVKPEDGYVHDETDEWEAILEPYKISDPIPEKCRLVERLIMQFRENDGPKRADQTFQFIPTNKVHLPFLQLYLRCYQQRKGDLLTIAEIESLGHIEEVFELFLKDLNDRVLKKLGVGLPEKLEQRYPVVKFLKEFISPLSGHAQALEVEDHKALQNRVWFVDSLEKLDLTEMARILTTKEEGILRKIDDHYELSHPSLVVPIGQFNIWEELLKKDFDTSFAIWLMAPEGKNLLSRDQVGGMRGYKSFLISSEAEKAIERNAFWRNSVSKARRAMIIWNILLIGALFGFVASWYLRGEKIKTEIELVNEKGSGALKGEVYAGTGEAWKKMSDDRTLAYNDILSSFRRWEEGNPEFKDQGEIPPLASEFQHAFFNDYNRFPFYSQDIPLKSGYILSTKTRPLDSLHRYIFALTNRNDLFALKINFREKDEGHTYLGNSPISNVILYEPYESDSGDPPTQKILLIGSNHQVYLGRIENGIVSIDSLERKNGEPLIPKEESEQNNDVKDLEFIGGNRFVLGIGSSLYELDIEEESEKYVLKYMSNVCDPDIKNYKKNCPEVRQIKRLGLLTSDFVVLFGNSGLYKINGDQFNEVEDSISNYDPFKEIIKWSDREDQPYDIPRTHERIYSIYYNEEDSLLRLGMIGALMTYDFKGNWELTNYLNDEPISSIDESGEYTVLGSLEKKARIYRGNRLFKEMIGHTDAIYNVTFIDTTNYLISSGEDGRIKLWNLETVEKVPDRIPDNLGAITQIEYFKDNNIYISFLDRQNPPRGIMLNYDSNLNYMDSVKQELPGNANPGSIVAFDRGNQGLIAASRSNWIVYPVDSVSPTMLRSLGTNINDIEVVGDTLYIAANKGLFKTYLYSKYDTLINTLSTEKRKANSLDYSPEKNLLAAGLQSNDVVILNFNSKEKTVLNGHSDKINDVAFSENGNFLLSAGADNKVVVWSIDTTDYTSISRIYTVRMSDDVSCVDFYKDSQFLCASRNGVVKLYKVVLDEKGKVGISEMPSLISHNSAITAASFSNDGNTVITGDRSGNIKNWSINEFEDQIKRRVYSSAVYKIIGKWKWADSTDVYQSYLPRNMTFKTFNQYEVEGSSKCIWESGEYQMTMDSIFLSSKTSGEPDTLKSYKYYYDHREEKIEIYIPNVDTTVYKKTD